MHSGDIEIALSNYFDYRQKLIVPNVYWGLNFQYELDLIVVSNSNYATEIEIKISKSDLKADLKKSHYHDSNRIKQLYFAVPEKLKEAALELIPERAGLFIVREDKDTLIRNQDGIRIRFPKVQIIKPPKINTKAKKLTVEEINKLHRLASLRMWTLKHHLYRIQKELQQLKSENNQK
jgi:hypothetical protein